MSLNPYFGWYPMDGFSAIKYVKLLQSNGINFSYNEKRNYIEIKTDENPSQIHQLLGIELYSSCYPEDIDNPYNIIFIGRKSPMVDNCPPGAYH